MASRIWHGAMVLALLLAFAVLAWSTVTQSSAPLAGGPQVGTVAGVLLAWRVVRTLGFFTVQSNVLCLVVAWQLARVPQRDGSAWRVVRLDALLGIAVTGIVYSAVQAGLGAVPLPVPRRVHARVRPCPAQR